VGKWESRVLCGISKRGGKVCFWTFPRRVFSTARGAGFVVDVIHGHALGGVTSQPVWPMGNTESSIQMLVQGDGAAG